MNLSVLYLQNNLIFKIDNLGGAPTIKQLYLQGFIKINYDNIVYFYSLIDMHLYCNTGNLITKLENLESLIHLEKLYIGHNKISVLEGLEHNLLLKELHIQRQILNPGSSMCFDPRTMYCLNVSHLCFNKLCYSIL